MNELTIPKKLQPIVKAFYAESEGVAKALIIQAVKAIYGDDDDPFAHIYEAKQQITNEELEGVCALMQSLKPKDMFEALFAAQIVVSHMLGMSKLSKKSSHDQDMGLKLLRFSNEALCKLQKKRSGGMQNITVSYNHDGIDQKPIQTIITQEKGFVDYAD